MYFLMKPIAAVVPVLAVVAVVVFPLLRLSPGDSASAADIRRLREGDEDSRAPGRGTCYDALMHHRPRLD